MDTDSRELAAIRAVAERTSGLEILVLFGSRARGDTHQDSDWDFAYLATASFDASRLNAELSLVLRTDRVDLADLARAGGLLRFRAARDGVPMYESREGLFRDFWFEAVRFWCDAGPVLDASYDALLAKLDR
jgi:predicted nucleotidyltransferase